MATIYRFVIEQKASASGGGRKDTSPGNGGAKKGAAKKGKWVSIFGCEKGGVEHNRKMRVVNPVINKMSYGYWEKGTRAVRAATGLVKRNTETGKLAISGTAWAILFQMVLLFATKMLQNEQERAKKLNAQNYKQLEDGIGQVNSAYEISTNILTGRHTYNQNK